MAWRSLRRIEDPETWFVIEIRQSNTIPLRYSYSLRMENPKNPDRSHLQNDIYRGFGDSESDVLEQAIRSLRILSDRSLLFASAVEQQEHPVPDPPETDDIPAVGFLRNLHTE